MTIWFTSDTHFSHAGIVEERFANRRPFASIEEHDEALIANWNGCIGQGDTVYHLGDFSLSRDERAIRRVFNALNG